MQDTVVFGFTPWRHASRTGTGNRKAPRLPQCLDAVACSYLRRIPSCIEIDVLPGMAIVERQCTLIEAFAAKSKYNASHLQCNWGDP